MTAAAFVLKGAGVCAVLGSLSARSFPLLLGSFLALFVLSGIGNGSTYQMIPAILRAEAMRATENDRTAREAALALARTHAAAVIGLASAIGAFGGFLIPRGFGISMSRTGSISAAVFVFLAGYLSCLVVTWWCYLRSEISRNEKRTTRTGQPLA